MPDDQDIRQRRYIPVFQVSGQTHGQRHHGDHCPQISSLEGLKCFVLICYLCGVSLFRDLFGLIILLHGCLRDLIV